MSDAKNSEGKVRRPKAETPKGFRDYFGAEDTERKAMLDKVAEVYHRYGFDPLETSAVETVEGVDGPVEIEVPAAHPAAWYRVTVDPE